MSTGPNPKLDELIEVMATLRGPGGCPWDAEQTHESLPIRTHHGSGYSSPGNLRDRRI